MAILLLGLALLFLGGGRPAHAQNASCVGTYGGVLDGNVHPTPPTNLSIDGGCTIQNYPASNPYNWNISWTGINDTLLTFNNVVFNGNMSCSTKEHDDFVWFVNGSVTRSHIQKCANLFTAVDKIDKQNPPGPPLVSIGVPFTYTLTFPQLVDPLTGAVVGPNGSTSAVDQITVTDDLNATGVSLSYVTSSAAWKGSGAPVTFSANNAGGLLTFSSFPPIPAGQQIVLSVTVVLNNATPPNSPGIQFSNTANWTLGTTIGSTFHYPLPGQQGVSSPPLTIAAPTLVITKGGPATMNPGKLGQFSLNVQNTGNSDAWNATIADKLPTGSTGGMCMATPQILSAQVFQADGVTPVPGKGPLTAGTDYTLAYAAAPNCALTLNMLSAAAVIGPSQRLIITYQTQLDANTQNGATLTNVAGATQWFSGPSSDTGRAGYICTLTNGTPGVADCQDAHTVTVVVPALSITKQVTVVGGGPAVPGATLAYLVHVTNTAAYLVNPVWITDDLNAAGAGALTYVAGTATMNGSPTGVSVAGNAITATSGALAAGATLDLSFQATLGSTLAAGTTVTNTGVVTWNNPPQTNSASASIQVVAPTPPALTLTKGGPTTMYPGQLGQFTLNAQNTGTTDAWNTTIVDQLPTGATGGMCTATPQILAARVFQADGVTPVPGKGPLKAGTDYTLAYTGTPNCTLTLNMLSATAVIGASQRLIITYQTQLDANTQTGATLTNVAGATQWYNAASSTAGRQSYTCTLTNGTPGVLDCQDAHTVTVVASAVTLTKQVSVVGGGPAVAGATLAYLVHVTNTSANPVNPVVITDNLNAAGAGALTYVAGTATMNGSPGGVAVAGNVITANYSGPLAAGATIDLAFQATLGSTLAAGTTVTNTGVVNWSNPPQTASGSASIQVVTPPALTLTKGGPATMYLGQLGQFTLNMQNTGTTDAWNATIVDKLPTGTTGGMCTATPQILSAQVFQADGVTAAPGKGPLTASADYTLTYVGAPTCTLTLNMLSAAAVIGPTQRLIITYQTQLDANTQTGVTLTNVAGATQWYNAASSTAGRQSYACTLTNGTPNALDCQDTHTVTVAASPVTVTKQVTVVGGGPPVAGATLAYLVHVTNTSANPVNPVVITDNLNAAGAGALTFVAGTATMNGSSSGVAVAGNVITANYSGPLAAGATIDLAFQATLGSTLAAGTTVTNTGVVTWNTPPQTASGSVSIQVVTPPALTLTKGGPATMYIGQQGQFTLSVQNTGTTDAWNATIVDKLPTGATGSMCTATPQILAAQVFQADGVTPVPGKGPLAAGTDYTLSYAGAPTCTLTLNMLSAAAVIGPTQRLIITYQTQLDANTQTGATLTNVAGATQWYSASSSTAGRQSYACTLTNGTPGVLDCQDAHTVTVVVSAMTLTKQVTVVGGGPAVAGATLAYLVHVTNTSPNPVNPVVITDNLNAAGLGALTYVAGTATMNGQPTGVSVVGNVITANYSGPLAAGATIDLAFQATLGGTLVAGTVVTNTGVVTWNNPPQTASGSVSIQVVTPPALTLTKGGPATMYIGQQGQFTLNVQNTGTIDAWNATIVDKLPTGATGGMCAAAPQILYAQVFQADGVTPAPGKGPLTAGTDYTLTYVGAPTCTLTLNMLTLAAVIGPSQRLIIGYQTQLDANTQIGATLTNVAGATQWYNAPSSNTGRQSYTCTLTNGTPGVLDCQDAHTVTVIPSAVTLTKQVTVVGGGPAVAGATLAYLVHVTNTSPNPVNPVVITDNLNAAGAGALTYVAGTATMNGSATGVTVAGNFITANYSGPLAAGGTIDLRFNATLGSTLAAGTVVTNTGVVTWNNPPQTASGSVSIQVVTPPALTLTKGGPTTMYIGQQGQFTLNVQNTGTIDAWNATILDKLPTGTTGGMCTATPKILSAQVFQADGVTPVPGKGPLAAGTDYTLTYVAAPGCTLTLNMLSAAAVIGTTQRLVITYQTQLDANTQNGIALTNVAGATQWYDSPSSNTSRQAYNCTLTNGTPGVLDCQDAHTVTVTTPAVTIIKQVTVVGGGPAVAGARLVYLVHVANTSANPVSPVVITDDLTAAGPGALAYVAGTATMNGSVTGVTVIGNVITANYSATNGPLAPGGTIDLSFQATLGSALPTGTTVTNTGVVTWNNPPETVSASVSIQVDTPPGALTVTKTTPLVDVTRGQLVPYTITATNVLIGPVQGVALVDRIPAGFRYVKGSARLDNTPAEPTESGLQLTWSNLNFPGGAHHTFTLMLAVGAGVGEGEFVNRAQAFSAVTSTPVTAPAAVLGHPVSAEASATVRVVPDTTFDCTDVFGMVFDDKNRNGVQDSGEQGIASVRVVTTRGLAAVTDEYGRFHITCAITPREGRGSNFALKLDDRTLPSGFRPTTNEVQVERATRGKALRFNFGAAIERVVSLDLTDAVFESGTTQMRPQWQPRIQLLLDELRKSPSTLRLSYLADVEESRLVDHRLNAMKEQITAAWKTLHCCYELNIESEVFWLRGSPPKEPAERLRGAK
jgi:uncharacterized repeat protein (TIGR01451 family)